MESSGRKALHRASQLLVRHLEAIKGSHLLIIGYPDDSFTLLLQQRLPRARIVAFGFDYATYLRVRHLWRAACLDPASVLFGACYAPSAELHDAAIVFLPRSDGLIDLALEATRRTLRANGLAGDGIGPSDVYSDVGGAYTRILSNPPFHTGTSTDYDFKVVEAMLKGAPLHLEPAGRMVMVGNRFLGYGSLIERYVGCCRVLAENQGYRVYEGSRAPGVR